MAAYLAVTETMRHVMTAEILSIAAENDKTSAVTRTLCQPGRCHRYYYCT